MPIKGRVHVVGSVLAVLADDMALGPPIRHWIIFFVRGCIDKILRKNISPKIKCKVWIL